jgi:hypothetical protein
MVGLVLMPSMGGLFRSRDIRGSVLKSHYGWMDLAHSLIAAGQVPVAFAWSRTLYAARYSDLKARKGPVGDG